MLSIKRRWYILPSALGRYIIYKHPILFLDKKLIGFNRLTIKK
jgi:hypothetical protein